LYASVNLCNNLPVLHLAADASGANFWASPSRT